MPALVPIFAEESKDTAIPASKEHIWGLEKWLQQLRALAALSEDPGSISSLQLSVTPVPGDLTPSHSYLCRQNITIHKVQINKLFFKAYI
ncbi:hypothetical protein I79_018888 [Cricetulus griseus]|uniref:Uncharacterized protein n=1 Tax=Cricetulus griseus TaxID=10029 RepID=G3I5X7_CRIGR|nr:hypothetical protein I79_018888 [Cricetulus griseus]